MKSDRGSALITVLWIVFIISIVSLTLAAAVRVEVASEMDSFDSERAFFMAKGAAETVYFSQSKSVEITNEHSPIRYEKGEYLFPFEGGQARVRLESNGGRVDINNASDRLLASLFDSVGVDQQTRNRLVDSVLDWRDVDDIPHLYGAEAGDYEQLPSEASNESARLPRNGPFGRVDELLLLKNMTPELFYGKLVADAGTGHFRRIPGIRDLVSVSGGGSVDVNKAGVDVLMALPQIERAVAEKIVQLRNERHFDNAVDLANRVPEIAQSEALNYIGFDSSEPSSIVSTATIGGSGTSRTVRILFSRDQRLQYFSFVPLMFKKIDEMKFGRWQHQ